jgi:hypothetical protein
MYLYKINAVMKSIVQYTNYVSNTGDLSYASENPAIVSYNLLYFGSYHKMDNTMQQRRRVNRVQKIV